MNNPLPLLLLIAGMLVSADAQVAEAALASPATRCSLSKLKSASSSLLCSLKARAKAIGGGVADTSRCADRTVSKFERAESHGGCATTADAGLAVSRAENSAAGIMQILEADSLVGDDQVACARKKIKVLSKYVKCQVAGLTSRINHRYIGQRDDFGQCADAMDMGFAGIEATFACATLQEAPELADRAGEGYGFLPGVVWDTEHVRDVPLPRAYLVGSDFTGAYLSGANFRGADLSGTTFETINRFLSDLEDQPTDFRDANFDGARFSDVRLFHDQFDGAQMATVQFGAVQMTRMHSCPASLPPDWRCAGGHFIGPTARFSYDDLENLDLTGANLSYATIHASTVSGSILKDADLSHASIEWTAFEGTDLAGADLSSALLRDLWWPSLVNCPAALPSGWGCVNRNLVGDYVHLRDADLVGADMSGLRMRNAEFRDSDLTGADWTGADLDRVSFHNTTCPDGTLNTDDVQGSCCGHHVGGAPIACGYP